MRYMLVGATATMALLGAATLGYAQAPDDKNKGPAAQDKSQQAPDKAQPRAGAETNKEQPKAAQQPTTAPKDQPKAAQQQQPTPPKDTDGQRATQDRTTDRPKGAEAPKGDVDKKSSKQQADKSKDTTKRTENPDRGKDKSQKATEQKPADRDRTKATEGPKGDMDKQKSTQDRNRDQTKSAEQPKQGERLKVSEQQRTSVREQITKTRVEKTRINVNVNVGVAVPRSVRLHTLPAAIVSIAPEYRDYSYIVLEDETIVIVNPRTYVIVDYIPAGSMRADRPGRTHLTLSRDEMRFVFRAVPKERTANVRARLALGAEVPRDVELLVFPRDVVQRIPALDRYRYVVSGGDVIIVDPSDHEVALVIDE
jgi:hypothetical protein